MKHLGTQTLETKRLILRRFSIEDARDVFTNWASDPEVTRYLTWPPHQSIDDTERFISYAEEASLAGYEWAIELKEIGKVIGSISAVSVNEEARSAEIGYCLGKKFWHKGYMTEALSEVMRFFFEKEGLNRVSARCDVRNSKSAKVMEAAGMVYEGRLNASAKNNQGIVDMLHYAKVLQTAEELSRSSLSDEHSKDGIDRSDAILLKQNGKNIVTDELIDYVETLAQLSLSSEERVKAKIDIGKMLDHIDRLSEMETDAVEPMTQLDETTNVFREDEVTNRDGSESTLKNAPKQKDGGFKVPKTIGE